MAFICTLSIRSNYLEQPHTSALYNKNKSTSSSSSFINMSPLRSPTVALHLLNQSLLLFAPAFVCSSTIFVQLDSHSPHIEDTYATQLFYSSHHLVFCTPLLLICVTPHFSILTSTAHSLHYSSKTLKPLFTCSLHSLPIAPHYVHKVTQRPSTPYTQPPPTHPSASLPMC